MSKFRLLPTHPTAQSRLPFTIGLAGNPDTIEKVREAKTDGALRDQLNQKLDRFEANLAYVAKFDQHREDLNPNLDSVAVAGLRSGRSTYDAFAQIDRDDAGAQVIRNAQLARNGSTLFKLVQPNPESPEQIKANIYDRQSGTRYIIAGSVGGEADIWSVKV